MGEHAQDAGNAGKGPLETALQDDTKQAQGSGQAGSGNEGSVSTGATGPPVSAPTGRASFTTPGAVSSVNSMAAKAESFSDPIAGEAEAGAELLERAKRQM